MSQNPQAGETHSPLISTRRGALGTLGLGALAYLSTNAPAAAVTTAGNQPKVTINPAAGRTTATTTAAASRTLQLVPFDASNLPQEWVLRQGNELKIYYSYLVACRLQRLTPEQIIHAHAKQHGLLWNSLPPRSLWRQMVPTLRVIDRVAMELGQPVGEIVSAYRSPSYNATCPGARSGSWHQANVAVDVKFAAGPSSVAGAARKIRGTGIFRGGVGLYDTFTHIDTRGENVDW
jgi:hypothetical protein